MRESFHKLERNQSNERLTFRVTAESRLTSGYLYRVTVTKIAREFKG